MSQTIQMGEFFVVGGPVQPDRRCYLERAADGELIRAIGDGEFCYVLAPPALGKTSLMGHAVRILREQGQAAALVDLTQVGAREPSSDPSRWFYSIAYRIVRELRLKLELQSWWQENGILAPEQRLAEFFRDIVLGNTRTPVTLFFDELERTLELPFAKDFFGEIRASYNARTTEPEFDRLNFVLLGASSPERLCPDQDLSPFSMGRAIELNDFSFPEILGLAPGFGIDIEKATALLKRVHHWTGGQPYLTQKLARAVARRSSSADAADVDQLVQERFLNAAAAKDEPHFNSIRTRLTHSKGSRQSLSVLGQVAKGDEVEADLGAPTQENLYLAGLVTDSGGRLSLRNRIYAQVFNAGWVNSVLPFDIKVFGSALAAAALVILLPVWYSQVLPRPYIATLSSATQDLAVAKEAYRRLDRLPGFSGTANRLFAEVLSRRSRQAADFAQWQEADTLLRELDDQTELAQDLEAEFWLRTARAETAQQNRDRALIFALKANESGKPEGLALARSLLSTDYPNLAATFRFQGSSRVWGLDPEVGTVAVVDERLRVGRLSPNESAFQWSEPLRARQFFPLERTLTVTAPGRDGGVSLELEFSTAVPTGLTAMLTDPRGQRQVVSLRPREDAGATTATTFNGLSAGEGTWRLDLIDSAADGKQAAITRWCVAWGGACQGEETSDPAQIPEPIATDDIDIVLVANRSLAVALPRRMPAGGNGIVWDYARGKELGEFALQESPLAAVVLEAQDNQVFLAESRRWGVYSLTSQEWLWQRKGLLGAVPQLNPSQSHTIVEEVDTGGRRALSVLDTATGQERARFSLVPGTAHWALLADAEHVVLGTGRSVELVELETGNTLARRVASAPIAGIVAAGQSVVVVDESGSILQWSGLPTGLERERWLGRTIRAASLYLSDDGRFLSFQAGSGEAIVVRNLEQMTAGERVRHPAYDGSARIDTRNELIVTHSPGEIRLWRMRQGLPAAPADGLTQRRLAGPAGPLLVADAAGQVRAVPVDNNRVAPIPQLGFVGHGARVTALAASESIGLFASGDDAGAVRLWSLETGDPFSIPLRHAQGSVRVLALGGSWVASGAELVVRVWRTDTGAPASEIPVADGATALAFSADATLLAVGDGGGNILLTAPEAQSPLRALRGQAGVTALTFAPGGQRLAAGDQDGGIYLFDPLTGEYAAEPLTLDQPIHWLGYSGDERIIARSGDWLHWISVSAEGRLMTLSQALLPTDASGVAAIGSGGTVHVPTGSGLRLQVRTFTGATEASGPIPGVAESSAEWLKRLALTFDDQSGTVRFPATESVN